MSRLGFLVLRGTATGLHPTESIGRFTRTTTAVPGRNAGAT
jgi:hypothetical protein